MNFHYTAKMQGGDIASGFLDVASTFEAKQRLQERGLFPLTISPAGTTAIRESGQRTSLQGGRIKKSDLLMLTCQLRVMIVSGVDLAEALKNVAENCNHAALSRVLKSVYEDVAGGKTMSAALERHANVFGEAYVASVAAAEASGTMPLALGRLAELQRNEIRLRGSLVTALAYPLVLALIAVIVVVVLLLYVLPQFGTVFKDLGSTPPMMTQFLFDISDSVRQFGMWGLGSVVLLAVFVWQFWLRGRLMIIFDHLILNGAVLRRASRPLLLGHSFRLLATVLESGVPLLEALHLARRTSRNSQYQALFSALSNEVRDGKGIASTLASTEFVPRAAAQMVQTAEESGDLGGTLETVGFFYEEEGERELKQLVSLLEPAIIVLMGLVVAVVVAAVMLPLLDVSSAAH